MKDLFPTDKSCNSEERYEIIETYDYRDEKENLSYKACRMKKRIPATES